MKTFFTALSISISVFEAAAQLTPTVNPVIDQFGSIQVKRTNEGKVTEQSSIYLYDDWISADVLVHQPAGGVVQVKNTPVKLDLLTSALEVQTSRGIRLLPLSKVEKFEWINPQTTIKEVFVNGRDFLFNGAKIEGYCAVSGDLLKMVTHYSVEIIPADYNVALDVGSKEDRAIKKTRHYLLRGNELIEFTKKSVVALMPDEGDAIKQFIRKNRVDFDEEADLQSLIRYCDTLVQ